jgi:hypothetical protein
MTRPTEPVLWAETADPSDVTEPAGKRPAGYQYEDELPHDDFNAIARATGRWLEYSKRSSLTFPSMVAALDASIGGTLIPSPGDVCEIDLDPATSYPGQVSGTATGEAVVAIDCDGLYYYVATRSGADVFTVVQRRCDTDAITRTFALTGTPDASLPIRDISCDGVHLGVAWGERFEVFTVSDGVRRIDINLTAQGRVAIACDLDGASAVLFAADGGASTGAVVRYSLATYTTVGLYVFAQASLVGAVVSTGANVIIAYQDGSDVTVEVFEYLASLSVAAPLSTLTISSETLRAGSLRSDGRLVALSVSITARVYRIRQDASGVATLVALYTLSNPPGANVGRLDMSRDMILVGSASAQGRVWGYSKASGDLVVTHNQEDGTGLVNGTVVTSDGRRVYYNTTNAARRVAIVELGEPGGRWRRCAGTEQYRSAHRLLIPV